MPILQAPIGQHKDQRFIRFGDPKTGTVPHRTIRLWRDVRPADTSQVRQASVSYATQPRAVHKMHLIRLCERPRIFIRVI